MSPIDAGQSDDRGADPSDGEHPREVFEQALEVLSTQFGIDRDAAVVKLATVAFDNRREILDVARMVVDQGGL